MITTDPPSNAAGQGSFPKGCRLRTASEFKSVYRDGQKSTSRSFVVFVLPNGKDVLRFGLTTPRKLGRAHDRNRIRRRTREILRQERLKLRRGFDVVVNPRGSVLERDFEALRGELLFLLDSKL